MSDKVTFALLRSAMIVITIVGAVYVFVVINNVRQGDPDITQIITGFMVIAALVWMNRWWLRRSGTRL
jgi:hypothetical protein